MVASSARVSCLAAATLFFWSTFPTPAPAQTVSFIARRDFAVGVSPEALAVGDLNGDGVLDLAVVGPAGPRIGGVSVMLGQGEGTFPMAGNFFAFCGRLPSSVAVADFNGDGVPDLAVANTGSNNVSVLLGNGDGSFQAAESFAVATGPSSVVVGDFNGDGKLDLAVTTEAGSPAPPLPTDTVS